MRSVLAPLLFAAYSTALADVDKLSSRIHDRVVADLGEAVNARYGEFESIEVSPVTRALDSRACDALETQIQAQRLFGRVSVLVRCTTPAAFSLYVTANVVVETAVVFPQRAILRGEAIAAEDVRVERMSMHQVRSDHVLETAAVIGRVAKRNLSPRSPLRFSSLTVANAVEKGDRVTIEHSKGRVRIHSAGIALEDGRVGEQISVRNERSERVVRPWVVARGRVSTSPAR